MGIINFLFGSRDEENNLDSNTFQKMIEQDPSAVLIDVRTYQEFQNLRIPNSILIDIYQPTFLDKIDRLERNKTYYVYCRSGKRSFAACKQMKKMGFEKVFNLKSGIKIWKGNTEHG